MQDNYFDRAKNEGYYQGQKYLDYNKYLQAGGRNMDNPGGGSGGSYEDQIARSIAMHQEANKPAIQSLESSIPQVGQRYEQQRGQLQAEKAPMEQRYSELIGEIKGNQQTAENRQTKTTNAELARRGIGGGSLYDQTLTDAVNPVTQGYTTLLRDTGLSQEKGIRELLNSIASSFTQQTSEEQQIRNMIAQLQSGAASQGIQTGTGVYESNLARQFQQQQAQQEQALRQAAQALAEKEYNDITLPRSQADIQSIMSLINKRGLSSQFGQDEWEPV